MTKKLLLADDSITIQKVIGITFANEDFDLIITDNGDAALEKVRAERPDLVLADVYMPGKNGYELCSAIKHDPVLKQIPVLLLTGTFEPFDEAKAKSVGADGWIAKPFESQGLIRKVEELLSRSPEPVPAPEIHSPPAPPAVPMEPETAAVEAESDMWEDVGEFEMEPEAPPAAAEPGGQTPADKEWEDDLLAVGKEESEEDLWGSVSFDEEDLGEEEFSRGTGVAEISPVGEFEEFDLDGEKDSGLTSPPVPSEGEGKIEWEGEQTFEFEEEPSPEESPAQPPVAAKIELDEDVFEFEEETPPPPVTETETAPAEAEGEGVAFEEDMFEFEEEGATEEVRPAPAVEGEAEFDMADFEIEEEPAAPESQEPAEKEEIGAGDEEAASEIEEEILSLEEVEILEEEDLEAEAEPTIFAEGKAEPLPPLEEEPSDEMPHAEVQHAAGEGEWGFEEPLPPAGISVPEPEPAVEEPVSRETIPAMAPAALAEEQATRLTEEDLKAVVEKVAGQVIERLAGSLLEKIAWEVVPDLAESIVREEVRKIKEAAE